MEFLNRLLSMAGVRATVFAHCENWRRAPGCDCIGCRNWHRIERGERVWEDFNQDLLRCTRRFLVWTADTPIDTRWNLGMACLWIAILAVCFFNLYASIGVVALVTTGGKNDMVSKYFASTSYNATWYLGLVDGSGPPTYAVGDSLGSHPGWTENTSYSNASRPTWTGGTASGGSIDNSLSPAQFGINASVTIAGQFLVNSSTKGGTVGTLYSEANFQQGNRSANNGDLVNCWAALSVA